MLKLKLGQLLIIFTGVTKSSVKTFCVVKGTEYRQVLPRDCHLNLTQNFIQKSVAHAVGISKILNGRRQCLLEYNIV